MRVNKKEPSDSESLWLKIRKLTPSILCFGRLVFDVVKLIIER
ncbi:hypothetical protein ACLH3R_000603 [Flavobacterium psychrophilum]